MELIFSVIGKLFQVKIIKPKSDSVLGMGLLYPYPFSGPWKQNVILMVIVSMSAQVSAFLLHT